MLRGQERMDQNLFFNVAQLLKEAVGATRSAAVVADVYELAPDVLELVSAESTEHPELAGRVRLIHTGNGILVRGNLTAELTAPCSRCLEPVSVPIAIDLEEVFTPTIDIISGQAIKPEEDDRALWIDEHHILDLSEVLRQDLLVAMPMHPLCREDCRGLCSTCGQNLNEGNCHCAPEPDPRWAGLAALLNQAE
jgi:uncharacterized protein